MKKTIAIILSVVMILSLVSVAAVNAASDASFTVDDKTYDVNVGDTFNYTLNLTTSAAIENAQLIVYYPAEVMKVKEVKFDDAFLGTVPICNYNIPSYPGEVDINLSKVDATMTGIDFTTKHLFCDITFEVIGKGTGAISISDKQGEVIICDVNDNDITSTSVFEKVVSGIKAPEDIEPEPTKPTVTKKANPVKVKVAAKKVKAANLKKKAQTVKVFKVTGAKGAVTVAKVKKGSTAKIFKKVTVKKNGKIVIKKGKYAKKTYKVVIKVTAKGNSEYKSKTIKKTIKIKVK